MKSDYYILISAIWQHHYYLGIYEDQRVHIRSILTILSIFSLFWPRFRPVFDPETPWNTLRLVRNNSRIIISAILQYQYHSGMYKDQWVDYRSILTVLRQFWLFWTNCRPFSDHEITWDTHRLLKKVSHISISAFWRYQYDLRISKDRWVDYRSILTILSLSWLFSTFFDLFPTLKRPERSRDYWKVV